MDKKWKAQRKTNDRISNVENSKWFRSTIAEYTFKIQLIIGTAPLVFISLSSLITNRKYGKMQMQHPFVPSGCFNSSLGHTESMYSLILFLHAVFMSLWMLSLSFSLPHTRSFRCLFLRLLSCAFLQLRMQLNIVFFFCVFGYIEVYTSDRNQQT